MRKVILNISEAERYQIEILLKEGLSSQEIGKRLKRDRRTIEREISRGSILQRDTHLREINRYCADVGQRIAVEQAANKGRCLKIGHDYKLVKHIEKKIIEEKYSPDAVIGEIKESGLIFKNMICTKTLYNYIESGLFLNISN